ncbi:caspase family protein [Streptomyces sp. NRAIS4]
MKRYVVAAGTRRYREAAELPLAHQDADRAAGLFESMGYQRILAKVSYDPAAEEFENALADWCRSPGLAAEDVVVVYYAGHGDRSPAGRYRLACSDSESGRPRSWLSPMNLAEILATSPIRNVLFVVDACLAAAAASDIASITDAIVASRARADDFGSGTWLLASARHRDLAVDGAFVTELAAAYRQGDGPSQRHLAPSALAERVNRSFLAGGVAQRAACSSVDHSEPPPFFPNPGFDPSAEVLGEDRTDPDVSDLSSHFEPRGRGVEHVHDPGSYFTGRARALGTARAHLAGDGPGGLLAVTADPGSGKSAVLGRLVMEGCTDASVNAHHQTLEALVGRLAAAADVRATTADGLFAALAGRTKPFRVVVDSLDEAGAGGDKAEARRIGWDLLRPLSGVACVRLVVGSRRELLPHLGDQVPVVDLDDSAYADDTDTAAYVEKILCDTGAPYARNTGPARRIAREVARRAGRCFLVARMTASALLRGPVVDTGAPGWAEQLPSDVGGAFDAYLQRLPSSRHAATMALLTALAFGEGNGLPRRVWVPVAARLSGLALVQADVDMLLEEDGSYLAGARVDGTTHFRLYHQELTDHLKRRVLRHRDPADVQECFVDTLSDLVPQQDWTRAPYYVRAHLATHAAASGALDDLLEDASFLVSAVPSTLLPAVRQAVRRPSVSMVVERYAYLLVDAESDWSDRAALLAFVARTYGEHALAERAEGIAGSIERLYAEPRAITAHRIVGRHRGDAYAINQLNPHWLIEDVVLPDGGRAVLAAPPWSASVHVWFLDEPAQSTILPHPAIVAGLAVLRHADGGPQAVTLDDNGTLRLWNLADQTSARTFTRTGFTCLFDAGFHDDGTPVVVCADREHVAVVRSTDLETVREVPCFTNRYHRWNNGPGGSACLAHGEDGTVRLLLCDGVTGLVTLHPLDEPGACHTVLEDLTSPVLVDRITGPAGTFAAIRDGSGPVVLLSPDASEPTAVSFPASHSEAMGFARGSADEPVFVAMPNSGHAGTVLVLRPGSPAVHSPTQVQAGSLMAPLTAGGTVYAVTANFTNHLEVMDCATGRTTGMPLSGHEGAVCAVRVLDHPGAEGPDILAIGNDGTARLWTWDACSATVPHNGAATALSPSAVAAMFPWSWVPGGVLTATTTGSLRCVRADPNAPLVSGVELPEEMEPDQESHADGESLVEESDGTVNILGWQDGAADTDRVYLVWHRLGTKGQVETVRLPGVLGRRRDRTHIRFLGPTDARPHTRLMAFDRQEGQVRLLESAGGIVEEARLPSWEVSDDQVTAVTAMTTPEGHDVVLAAVCDPYPGRRTIGRLWDVSARRAHQCDGIELIPECRVLLPERTAGEARWVAQIRRDGRIRVLDVTTGRQHTVNDTRLWRHRMTGSGIRQAVGAHWVHLADGGPLLVVRGARSGRSASDPFLVWDARNPSVTRPLPLEASHILWTGHSPSGEALLALSDAQGLALCHLPSGAPVWRTPVPARVTALTAVPGSPHLDIAVGTQQGVVFLRPRLSRSWRDRLGLG